MFTWIVTGAAGHLGGTIVRLLQERKAEVRGLVLPHESAADQGETRYFTGDVTLPETLVPLFEGTDPARTVVIHTAGLIDIGDRPYEELRRVNVEGTRNVLALCRQYGVRRLVYVSSVHAIAQDPDGGVLRETSSFSPDAVAGSYAKTKAEATRDVLDAAAAGLDAVVVHPSGILGPYDNAGNHLVQVIRDYMTGKLPACVRGGYDMVDVAAGASHGAGARRGAAAGRFCPDARAQAAVHRLFPPGACQQRPLFARQGHQGAGLPPARPAPDRAGYRALAAKPRRAAPPHAAAAPPRGAGGGLSLQQMKRRGCRRFYSAATSFFARIIPTRRFHESRLRQIWKNTLNQPGA